MPVHDIEMQYIGTCLFNFGDFRGKISKIS